MCPWLQKIANSKRKVARKSVSSAIIKTPGLNIEKKTVNKGRKTKSRKSPSPTSSNSLDSETRQNYRDALARLIEAARNCEYIDNPNLEPNENFSRTRIDNDYWHTTRVPEGPRTHLVLSRSEPHTGVDLVSVNTAKQMEHIYQDLHEMSFQGLTSSTLDLDPALPEAETVAISDVTRYSIQTDLAHRTKEMMMVINSARLHRQYQAWGNQVEHQLLGDIETAVRTVRTAPDNQRRAEALAFREWRKNTRYGHFAAEHGWMMLSILANSVAFRSACHSFDDELWFALDMALTEQARSVELFAKVRGLNWRTVLTKTPHIGNALTGAEIRSTMNVPIDHPHNFTLTLEGDPQRPRHQGRDQLNINQNIYNADLFESTSRPRAWPQGLPFPRDPTIRRSMDGPCHICHSPRQCNCRMETAIFHPLVEITSYPGKGNGIRALQYIPADTIIGEYVGELHPLESTSDPTYSLEFSGGLGAVALIQCRHLGNWTRYMNHSCNPTAYFNNYTIGDRVRMCIRTVRETNIFEEVTVHYGSGYWNEAMLCRCGEPDCEYNTVAKVQAARARSP